MAAAKKKINKAKSRENAKRNVLTPIGIYKLWEKQGGRCALSSFLLSPVEGTFPAKCKRPRGQNFNEYGFAIDRIDSTKDYTYDNVQLVTNTANQMKGSYDQQHILTHAAAMFATSMGLTNNKKLFDDVVKQYEERV